MKNGKWRKRKTEKGTCRKRKEITGKYTKKLALLRHSEEEDVIMGDKSVEDRGEEMGES